MFKIIFKNNGILSINEYKETEKSITITINADNKFSFNKDIIKSIEEVEGMI